MARIKTAYMILAACLLAINSYCQDKTDHRYVFFLHNMFIEINGPEGVHPEYGKAEYREILNVFKKEQFNVISEVRARNTDVNEYALKTIKQIDSLLKKGVPPSHITVIGTSKGGYIAMTISARLKTRV